MNKWEEKSNNEILAEILVMQQEHEALKTKMLSDFNKLEEIEKLFNKANEIIIKRLKR